MISNDANLQQTVRRYLLGELTPEGSSLVEERLLTDDDFYHELLAGEDDLIDGYLAGELLAAETRLFDVYFMTTPERQEKLRFARGLRKYVNQAGAVSPQATVAEAIAEAQPEATTQSPNKRGWFWFLPWQNPAVSYSLAAAAVVVLAVTTILITRNLWVSPAGPVRVMAVELTPGLSRGDEGIKQITVSPDITRLQLQLILPNLAGYQKYRAIVQDAAGREISRLDNMSPDPATKDRINYPLPASDLQPGDYNLKLGGLNQQGEYEEVHRYFFRLNKN